MRAVIVPVVAVSLGAIWTGCSTVPDQDAKRHTDAQSVQSGDGETPSPSAAILTHQVAYLVAEMPKASCLIHPARQNQPSISIQADELGVVRFREASSAWGTALSLDCPGENGTTRSYTIDLTDPNVHTPPSIEGPPSAPTIRPALTGDLARYTPNQLIDLGYPPAPDPKSSSYSTWRQIVTTPMSMIHGEPIPLLGDYNVPQNDASHAWGGEQLRQPATEYIEASADFYVPSIYNDGYDSLTSQWVGIGGWNADCALIQAGIEMDLSYIYFYKFGWTPIQSYYAWIEYFPDYAAEVPLNLDFGRPRILSACA
jgi:hypothetical protein